MASFINDVFGDTVAVGIAPAGVAVNPNTNTVYVANQGSGTVSVIDGSTNTVIATIPAGLGPFGVAVNPSTNMAYVANLSSNTVSVIDGSTNTVIATIPVGNSPFGVAVNPNTNMIYAASLSSNTVSVIDGSTNTVIATIALGLGPSAVAVNPNTNTVYVNSFLSNTVSVIDGSTNTVIATIPVGNGPTAFAVNPNTNKVYVSNSFLNTVSVIDGSTNTVIATIPVDSPLGVDVDLGTNRLYVGNQNSDTVSVIDGSTNTVIATIPVGDGPRGVAFNPNSNTVYVGNQNSNDVSLIQVSANSPPVANAGDDQTVNEGVSVTLDGTASSDPDDATLTFSWTQTAGPAVTLSNTNIANPTFIAPQVDAQTVLTFQLIVSDGTFNSVPDTVNIIVNDLSTIIVPLIPQPSGVLTANVPIGDVPANTTIRLQFQTPPGSLPLAQLQEKVIPVGVSGSGVTFDFIVAPEVLPNLPPTPIETALFFSIDFTGIDFSDPSNFQEAQLPKSKFIVDKELPSDERFQDGCPVVAVVLLNENTGQWEQLGDPLEPNSNTVYVANQNSDTVSVIDISTNTVIATIPVGIGPRTIAFNPNTNTVYVANLVSNMVSVIDASTNTVIDTIAIGGDPFGVTINPNTNVLYVTNLSSNTVSVIDASTNNVIATIPVGSSPVIVAVNQNTNTVYVTNLFSNTVSVIDGSTNTVIATIPVSLGPARMDINQNTNTVYVTNLFSNTVSVIDGSTNTVIATIPVSLGPRGISANPNTNTVYVTNFFSNTVSVIDGSTNTVIATIPVGNGPVEVDVNPNTNTVYVTNFLSNTVSVIDGSTNTVIATIPVGNSPSAVVVNPNVTNPIREPSSDVIDENTSEILQCAYTAQLPHISKFSVGRPVKPTSGGSGGGGGGEFRGRVFAFGDPDSPRYDGNAPSIREVLTQAGSLKVSAKILDEVGVKDAKLIVNKNTILMQRLNGTQNWWEGTIPSTNLPSSTVFFKIVARDYNNNIGEYSGSASVPYGSSSATSIEGASFVVRPLTMGYQPDEAYSIIASGVRPSDQNTNPQITIKNSGTEPLQNIRLILSPELKGKFLLSYYAIKNIAPNSEFTVSLTVNGKPNIDVMNNPIPYSGQVIISVDNRSPVVLELSGVIPNESASLQSIFMKMIASKAEQRYKSLERPDLRISQEPEYGVTLGSGESMIKSASDELIISNTSDKPLKNLRIITSSISDHFLLDQKNIDLLPAGSFVKVKFVSNLNDAESYKDLQGELLIVPEYGAPVTIPINIGRKLPVDRNSMYDVYTISHESISNTAQGIVIRNNSEESIDNVRIILPRELARVLSVSEDSFRSIAPNSEKIVYLQPRGALDSRVKHVLSDYVGEILIVSSDGMKKVMPVNIVWKGITSEHFVIYVRNSVEELTKATQVINSLERSYTDVTRMIDGTSTGTKTRTVIYMTSSLEELNMLSNALAPSTYVYDEDVGFVWSNSEDVNILALKEFAYRTIMQNYGTYWTKEKISLDRSNWLVDGISNYVTARIVGERGVIVDQLDAFIAEPVSFEWYGTPTLSQYGASYTLFKFLAEKYGDTIIDKTLDYLGSTMVSNHRCDTIEQCALLRAVYDVNGFDINDKRHNMSFATIEQQWKEHLGEKYLTNALIN